MKTILLGEAPPKSRPRDTPESRPFSGASSRRFSDMIGEDVVKAFDTRNLLSEWPGSTGKGSKFPLAAAQAGAHRLLRTLPSEGTRIILCGRRVARAMSLRWLALNFGWYNVSWQYPTYVQARAILIPHPSGVNRQWNDPKVSEAVKRILLAEVERMKSGTAAGSY